MFHFTTRITLAALLAVGSYATIVQAQEPAETTEEENGGQEELVVKIYRVGDLVVAAPDYPYSGASSNASPAMGGMGGGMGGMMGGGMGGGGMGGMGGGMGGPAGMGGMFQVADSDKPTTPEELRKALESGSGSQGKTAPAAAPSPTYRPQGVPIGSAGAIQMRVLVEALQNLIEPGTWDEAGGNGSISVLSGSLLAINQTPTVHEKIREFLKELQRGSATTRTLTITANWLLLNAEQMRQIVNIKGLSTLDTSLRPINSDALAALPADTRRYSSKISCLNGQTVHITSGRRQYVVTSAIPVVGGAFPAYQPVVSTPHIGAMLQVKPSILTGDEELLVDLHSTATRWDQPGKPFEFQGVFVGDMERPGLPNAPNDHKGPTSGYQMLRLDRPNIAAQEWSTTVRMPLGQPVLVAGMTFPAKDSSDSAGELCLVLEIQSSQKSAAQ